MKKLGKYVLPAVAGMVQTMRISAELRFVVAKLLSDVENSFSAEPPDLT